MIRFLIICSLFLVYSPFGNTQDNPWDTNEKDFDLFWGQLERSPGTLLEILPKNNTDFYSLRWSGGRTIGTYRVVNHENLQLRSQARIKQVAQTGIANFETAALFNDQLYVFLSDKADGQMLLYAQPYDDEMNTYDESILIASYYNERMGAKPNFSIKSSENREYFAVFWEIPGRKARQDDYGYVIMDAQMNEL